MRIIAGLQLLSIIVKRLDMGVNQTEDPSRQMLYKVYSGIKNPRGLNRGVLNIRRGI